MSTTDEAVTKSFMSKIAHRKRKLDGVELLPSLPSRLMGDRAPPFLSAGPHLVQVANGPRWPMYITI